MIDFLLFGLADFLASPMYGLAGIALAFAVSLIAISYMAGEFFGMPSLKGFAKLELSDLVVTACIFLIAVGLATKGGAFDMMSQGFTVADQNHAMVCADSSLGDRPAFAQAEYFLGCNLKLDLSQALYLECDIMKGDGVLLNRLSVAYCSLMTNEMFVGMLSGFSTNLELPIKLTPAKVNISMVPFIAMGPLNDVHTVLVDAIGVAMGAVAAQKMLLVFIGESALPFFLPFGLLLRAFPFSRKTGSTVLSVVFAAYFIYPTSILINQKIWYMMVDPQPDASNPASSICKTDGTACEFNSNCCSLNCRLNSTSNSLECYSPLTDFQDYKSVFGVCSSQPGITSDQINGYLSTDAGSYTQRMSDAYFNAPDPYKNTAGTKSETRITEGWSSAWNKVKTLGGGMLSGLMLPLPKTAVENTFNAIGNLVSDAMQFTILTMLFLVIEIIITMTLMKDFAHLIGGEPRVFGMSKLV